MKTTWRLVISRLAGSLLTLVGVSMLIFIIARVIPGDPAAIALGAGADKEQIEAFRETLGLNLPVWTQYFNYVGGLLHGDLGQSLYTNAPVAQDIAKTFPATFELVLVATIIMVSVGIPLGVVSAMRRDSRLDHTTRLGALLGVVTPSFVWAVLLMLVFSDRLGWLPISGRLSEGLDAPPGVTGLYLIDSLLAGNWSLFVDALTHIILPALALAMASVGQAARLTRANVVDTLEKPYIEMARAYGIPEKRIARRYALIPSLTPTLTVMGMDIAAKLGSAFLVESVFVWPGMAAYGVQTILNKDLNGIVGTVLVIAAFFLIVNMLVDLVVALIDPRVGREVRT